MRSRQLGRSRSFGAGFGRALLGLPLLVAGLAGCSGHATQAAAVPASAASTGASAPTPKETYGGYPSFLPPDTVNGGIEHRVVNASARRPALATQGDTVRVHVGATTVLATVTGPAVPVAGQQYQAPESPATWQVVLRHSSAALSLDPATFQAVDEHGVVHDLELRGRVPHAVRPGHVVRFSLFSPAFETGEGRLRWIPVGHLAPVEWDFVVETD